MKRMSFDINSDLGEGFGNYRLGHDEAMLSMVSSANVACGYHAGDPLVIAETIATAAEKRVAVGAHPGLPDLLGFGRRWMELSKEDMSAYWLAQLGIVGAFARAHGVPLHHAKPHGAMYKIMATDLGLAESALTALSLFDSSLPVYFPAPLTPTIVAASANTGVRLVPEVYVDLNYGGDGRLLVERVKRALDPTIAAERITRFLEVGKIQTTDGNNLEFEADSVCVHGDTPNGPEVLAAVRAAINALHIEICPP